MSSDTFALREFLDADRINSAQAPQEQHQEAQGPPPAPDGGFLAWLQCAAVFCVFFNSWGLLNSFGAFQFYYQQNLLRTSTPSAISWIGTIQASCILLGSVYSGPLYDAGYLRSLISIGAFMLITGMLFTSSCKLYWQVLLAQGFFMGIGLGCLFLPSAGIIASYFSKRKGLAMGIATSGSTIGGIIFSIAFTQLSKKLSFAWSTFVLAFIMVLTLIPPVAGMRMRTKPGTVRRLFDTRPWRETEFTCYALASFIGYSGMYIPYFYIQLFCLDKGIITGNLNVYLLPIINAGGFFGRLVFGALSDVVGPLNGSLVASGVCTILLFGWMGVDNEAGVLVFCVLYGFFSAGFIALGPTVVATVLVPDMRQFGVRFTMQLVPAGFGLLIGNPIAGAILPRGWLALQGFGAVVVAACTLLVLAARVARVGWAVSRKC